MVLVLMIEILHDLSHTQTERMIAVTTICGTCWAKCWVMQAFYHQQKDLMRLFLTRSIQCNLDIMESCDPLRWP